MKVKKKAGKRHGTVESVTQQEIDATVKFIKGDMGISEFMSNTNTTNSGSYSLIARAVRALFNKQMIMLNV